MQKGYAVFLLGAIVLLAMVGYETNKPNLGNNNPPPPISESLKGVDDVVCS